MKTLIWLVFLNFCHDRIFLPPEIMFLLSVTKYTYKNHNIILRIYKNDNRQTNVVKF